MTGSDACDFLDTANKIGLRPRVAPFRLEHANEALLANKNHFS
jgi:hypothetical protein